MRITENMTAQNSLYNIENARSQMNTLQEQLSSGQNVNRPSDDPVTARLLMNINDQLSTANQYSSNISKVDMWFQMADNAFTTMTQTLSDIRSKVSTVANGMATQSDLNNMVSYINLIKKTIVDTGNTDVNGVYIFAGTKNQSAPYVASTGDITSGSTTIANVGSVANIKAGMVISGPGIASGAKVTAVNAGPPASLTLDTAATTSNAGAGFTVYGGDGNNINVEMTKGSSESINIPGNQFITSSSSSPYGSVDILQTLDQLAVDLKANNTTGINNDLTTLDNGSVQLISAQTQMQSRMVRFDTAKTMQQSTINTLNTVLDKTQTADYAKLGIELQNQQTAFQATLSATAKISQMSLLNYI